MVDAAYERYKQAEAAEQENTEVRIDPLEAALRALSNPPPQRSRLSTLIRAVTVRERSQYINQSRDRQGAVSDYCAPADLERLATLFLSTTNDPVSTKVGNGEVTFLLQSPESGVGGCW
jgi:hypothetical protein